MASTGPQFECRLAQTPAEIQSAQRLRYDVFVTELGADGALVDHDAKLEQDQYDPFYDHLLLLDHARAGDPVVGSYRLLPSDKMPMIGRYYSEDEYDVTALRASGRRLLELGRSCVHIDYRGGTAMFHLWNGLANYVQAHNIEVLFGVASFHGTD
ncbi:MAG: GNAT family N-acetyltransferase, partial [Pseudomonadota bacterium]